MTATVVLVHGAWHGAWCWHKVVDELKARAIPTVAVDLPGHGASVEALGDLATDAAAVRATLDGIDRAVVCGHSYGGAVISEGAAGHPAVCHLVYIGALALAPGESCADAAPPPGDPDPPTSLTDALTVGDDGIATLDGPAVVDAFFGDCTPDDVEFALARLGPQAMASLTSPATRAAWREIPSTYVVCGQDRAVSPALQRRIATRTGDVVEWPTSHSPFLSQPALVADLLANLARQT